VIKVLSEDDSLPLLFKKCRNYVRIGMKLIFIVNPESRDAWQWSVETDNIERIQVIRFPRREFPLSAIWEELDKQLA